MAVTVREAVFGEALTLAPYREKTANRYQMRYCDHRQSGKIGSVIIRYRSPLSIPERRTVIKKSRQIIPDMLLIHRPDPLMDA